ncbi:MAG TPA: CoA transferase [Gammaproteobacteria bacterium]|nr:CoA transferase [Gammaproteobacteria bacterium]
MNTTALPLSRFTVLDLTRVRAGPTAVRQLADWGANVIKIESPAHIDSERGMGGARHGPDFQNLHRNKRSMTLNLKDPEGHAVFMRMVDDADVVVENFRPDVKNRLGINYAALSARNPKIVLGSVSGFGQDGPYVDRPGFDQIAQGMGGLMSITGLLGQGPVRVGVPIADLSAGLYAAIGILIALLQREETGLGQWVGSSLIEAQIAMLDFQAARWLMKGEVPSQTGNYHPTSTPTGVFPTADGHINVASAGAAMWDRLCTELQAEDLRENADYSSEAGRLQHREALHEALNQYFSTRTSNEWIEALNNAGVPCGPINQIDQVFADEQVKHLGMAKPISHPILGNTHVVNNAVRMSSVSDMEYHPTPERGEHTAQILKEFGYTDQEIQTLVNNKVT